MTRRVQTILYYLLPAIFWLLAIGGSLVPVLPAIHSQLATANYYYGYLVTALVLTVILIIGRIKRHESAVEPCFQTAVLLGIASYWLPTVVFLTLPVWFYLIYRHMMDFRAFMATLIGYSLVAIMAATAMVMGWIANPWAAFFAKENALGWIPLGAVLLAWIVSTIVRQNLRVR